MEREVIVKNTAKNKLENIIFYESGNGRAHFFCVPVATLMARKRFFTTLPGHDFLLDFRFFLFFFLFLAFCFYREIYMKYI